MLLVTVQNGKIRRRQTLPKKFQVLWQPKVAALQMRAVGGRKVDVTRRVGPAWSDRSCRDL